MSFHLKRIEVGRYGALGDRAVGPLQPGLNVVYGGNEAGKTTVASLVGGVLFGWEERRGVANTYRPPQGERRGRLVFERTGAGGASEDPRSVEVERAGGDFDGAGAACLLEDIDRSTYQALFFLAAGDSTALQGSDGAFRLMVAGRPDGSDPTQALARIDRELADRVSRADDAQRSVVRLNELLDRKRAQAAAASEEEEAAKQLARDLHELQRSREEVGKRLKAADGDIERLRSAHSQVQALEGRLGELADEAALLEEERQGVRDSMAAEQPLDGRLLALDVLQERALRDRLDELGEFRGKARRIVEGAKRNSAASQAAYEAFLEMDDRPPSLTSRLRRQTSHAVIAVIPTLAFLGAGIPLFIHGRQINSLSFTAFSLALILLAFLLAIAAVVSLFRAGRNDDPIGERRQDAQWVMLQDRKKLVGAEAEAESVERQIVDFLRESGLAQADGSLRQARVLLDEAAEVRTRIKAAEQREAALDLRIKAAREERERLQDEIAQLLASLPEGAVQEGGDPSPEGLEQALALKESQRQALGEMVADLDQRQGELAQQLQRNRGGGEFDRLKQECELIRTALRTCKHELVELILARRLLERSIVAWEGRSQPQIHRLASHFLSLITEGRWVEVALAPDGGVVAKAADGTEAKPRHLSQATVQQLHLALRIALLLSMEAVGRSIPVLADDILRGFDGERLQGAARALAELARHRQVIVFTGQEEAVRALRDADPTLTRLDL